MPIFSLKGDKAKKVHSTNFIGQDKEKKLQQLIEKGFHHNAIIRLRIFYE